MTATPEKKETKLPDQILEVIKWLIGTIGLGLVSICINQEIQANELKIKRLEADAKFLEVVSPVVEKGVLTDDRKYLEYILTFITSTDIRIQIQNKLDQKKPSEIKEVNEKINAKEVSKIAQAKTNLSEQQREVFRQVEVEESTTSVETEKSVESLIDEENEVAPDSESLDDDLVEIDSLQNAITPVILFEKEYDFELVNQPITKWCKKGYYVEFNNKLRIGIMDLKKKSIEVNLKDIAASRSAPKVLNKRLHLKEGQTWTEDQGAYKFQITLNRLGAAGKNPFTRAAYLTVSTYKKTTPE